MQHDLSPGEALALAQLQSKVLGEPVAPVFVGPYRLVRKLGEGGFGEVFLAYDTLHERRVALKLLRDDEETGAPRRLVREGKAIAALEHPNIVRCYEIGDATGTTPVYVALEYIEGETVRAWIERTSPSWEAIVEVFVAAGEALAYAHRRGIVHRDFKPSNVMVSARGEVKVLDFGLVCTMPDVSATGFTDQLTAPGTVLGTPLYMAPEQHLCDEVGPAADQFAWCAALFHMLYDTPPFEAPNPLLLAQAKDEHRLARIPEGRAPAWVFAVLARGMAPKPHDRWPDLKTLLRRFAPPWRRRGAWLLGLAVVVALLTGAWATW